MRSILMELANLHQLPLQPDIVLLPSGDHLIVHLPVVQRRVCLLLQLFALFLLLRCRLTI